MIFQNSIFTRTDSGGRAHNTARRGTIMMPATRFTNWRYTALNDHDDAGNNDAGIELGPVRNRTSPGPFHTPGVTFDAVEFRLTGPPGSIASVKAERVETRENFANPKAEPELAVTQTHTFRFRRSWLPGRLRLPWQKA